MPTSYAVIGASRGIGLEFVRQLAAHPDATVYAVVRNPSSSTFLSDAVKGLNNVHIVQGDVASPSSMKAAADAVGALSGGKLDCLIHNAAKLDVPSVIKGFDDFKDLDEMDDALIEMFKINALGPIHSISTFLPLLRAGPTKKVVVIGTEGGFPDVIRLLALDNMVGYGMSKAAAHTATAKWAAKLAPERFVVATVSPGTVDTTATMPPGDLDPALLAAMGAQIAAWRAKGVPVVVQTAEAAVGKMLKAVEGLTPEQNGAFLSPTSGVP
ncbi:NAD-P-binding protein [Epithele typhae]|uniref:NAD-P-binding protein n=1 Tax=Epithele typhae TaxID=378194 RepID=UPI002007580F|nr:NAD-P-binding protein [Epithele typhae]KAH9911359.1 NAD-P-binding protein [Epithele typhae]